jgi:hypothetical protein
MCISAWVRGGLRRVFFVVVVIGLWRKGRARDKERNRCIENER